MKNLTLLLFVSCFLYSQESTTENKIYHIITTDNDTIDVTWYRIGHSLFGSVCEFTLLSGKSAKGNLKVIKKIEDSNENELYPDIQRTLCILEIFWFSRRSSCHRFKKQRAFQCLVRGTIVPPKWHHL